MTSYHTNDNNNKPVETGSKNTNANVTDNNNEQIIISHDGMPHTTINSNNNMIIETDIDSTAEKDSEVTTQRIENAQATTSQNAIPDNEENNNKMETESVDTIASHQTGPRHRTYSQVTKQNITTEERMQTDDEQDYTQLWIDTIQPNIRKDCIEPFDINKWNYDKIIESLKDKQGITDFVIYKLQTKCTNHTIHPAIEAKFRHLDTAFFLTFTRTKKFMPPHQVAYEELFKKALATYKSLNAITITDKTTRDTIHQKLRQKIMIDFITNKNFNTVTSKEVYQIIKYYRGFTKELAPIKAEDIQEAIKTAFATLLEPLPSDPKQIAENILQMLPFKLPISQRAHTKAIVTLLHKIFHFDRLPEEYFIKLEPLPTEVSKLNPAVKGLFPITSRSALQNLAFYRKRLQDWYDCTTIPSNYFNLPPPRQPLPLAYQDLSCKYKLHFPIDMQDPDTDLPDLVQWLREDYYFKNIPNDYFKVKPTLPKNLEKIQTPDTFIFPIQEDAIAKRFVEQISPVYKFSFPLPPNIMTANPTDKPWLPEDPQQINDYNITTPIISRKQLVDTARMLREKYYFY
jgi:hypothetical protein